MTAEIISLACRRGQIRPDDEPPVRAETMAEHVACLAIRAAEHARVDNLKGAVELLMRAATDAVEEIKARKLRARKVIVRSERIDRRQSRKRSTTGEVSASDASQAEVCQDRCSDE